MKNKKRIRYIVYSGIIAAVYVVMTYVTNAFGLANGAIQCRFSEALCVLPAFSPAAVPGLFIGCLLSNILTGAALPDVVFGSLATLIGAVGTYFLAQKKAHPIAFPLPAIISNTVIIPLVLKYAYVDIEGTLWFFAVTVGIGEIISCGILGCILYYALNKKRNQIFK